MRCLIHVGTHHTGTTSLQKILSDQSDYLKGIGIIYPESIKEGFQHSLLPAAYFPDHYALQKNRSLDVDFYIEKLKDEIKLKNYKLCFLSSEVFTELLLQKGQGNSLINLFNKLDKIFDEISIFFTSRNFKKRAFSMHRAQIRLSNLNPKFRPEIFNAPERFRRKLLGTESELNKWKTLKRKIIMLNMEDSDMPILMYINAIIAQLDLNEVSNKEHSYYFREIFLNGNYILNEDPHKPVSYLLLILIGLKIKEEENSLKERLNLDTINKFIEDCDPKFKKYLFNIKKSNVMNFLENYRLAIFEESEIIDVFKKAELSFSSRVIIMKVIDDFILKLILDH